ncbi:MAG: T9SS type A sorting domain-containing protein [Marinifilaceae bacterium]|jgi:hypothetical protein|nr:T9SS type A sorting domain-containing protein [Marinifilaceae bacterium]
MKRKQLILLIINILFLSNLSGQQVLKRQGFEESENDNWNYTTHKQSGEIIIDHSKSLSGNSCLKLKGTNPQKDQLIGSGPYVEFEELDLRNYKGLKLKIGVSALGVEYYDDLRILISRGGGLWTVPENGTIVNGRNEYYISEYQGKKKYRRKKGDFEFGLNGYDEEVDSKVYLEYNGLLNDENRDLIDAISIVDKKIGHIQNGNPSIINLESVDNLVRGNIKIRVQFKESTSLTGADSDANRAYLIDDIQLLYDSKLEPVVIKEFLRTPFYNQMPDKILKGDPVEFKFKIEDKENKLKKIGALLKIEQADGTVTIRQSSIDLKTDTEGFYHYKLNTSSFSVNTKFSLSVEAHGNDGSVAVANAQSFTTIKALSIQEIIQEPAIAIAYKPVVITAKLVNQTQGTMAKLYWGFEKEKLVNEIAMQVSEVDKFKAEIPSQKNNSYVYYKIISQNRSEFSESGIHSYLVGANTLIKSISISNNYPTEETELSITVQIKSILDFSGSVKVKYGFHPQKLIQEKQLKRDNEGNYSTFFPKQHEANILYYCVELEENNQSPIISNTQSVKIQSIPKLKNVEIKGRYNDRNKIYTYIHDLDHDYNTVHFLWGTDKSAIVNKVALSDNGHGLFTNQSGVAFPIGDIYYRILATDQRNNSSESEIFKYEVNEGPKIYSINLNPNPIVQYREVRFTAKIDQADFDYARIRVYSITAGIEDMIIDLSKDPEKQDCFYAIIPKLSEKNIVNIKLEAKDKNGNTSSKYISYQVQYANEPFVEFNSLNPNLVTEGDRFNLSFRTQNMESLGFAKSIIWGYAPNKLDNKIETLREDKDGKFIIYSANIEAPEAGKVVYAKMQIKDINNYFLESDLVRIPIESPKLSIDSDLKAPKVQPSYLDLKNNYNSKENSVKLFKFIYTDNGNDEMESSLKTVVLHNIASDNPMDLSRSIGGICLYNETYKEEIKISEYKLEDNKLIIHLGKDALIAYNEEVEVTLATWFNEEYIISGKQIQLSIRREHGFVSDDIKEFSQLPINLEDQIEGNIFKPTIITGIVELNSTLKVNTYPNPTQGKFTISFDQYINGMISIYDYSGRLIHKRTISSKKERFDLENNVAGIYFIRIDSNNCSVNRKIAVIK